MEPIQSKDAIGYSAGHGRVRRGEVRLGAARHGPRSSERSSVEFRQGVAWLGQARCGVVQRQPQGARWNYRVLTPAGPPARPCVGADSHLVGPEGRAGG